MCDGIRGVPVAFPYKSGVGGFLVAYVVLVDFVLFTQTIESSILCNALINLACVTSANPMYIFDGNSLFRLRLDTLVRNIKSRMEPLTTGLVTGPSALRKAKLDLGSGMDLNVSWDSLRAFR